MKVRATKAIMECLLEQDVDTIFGYPGGTILNLYDELYNYKDKINHILTAHEQGAEGHSPGNVNGCAPDLQVAGDQGIAVVHHDCQKCRDQ
jgi:glyoxylate carboligase